MSEMPSPTIAVENTIKSRKSKGLQEKHMRTKNTLRATYRTINSYTLISRFKRLSQQERPGDRSHPNS